MKISVCFPQYNRIHLLEKSLRLIEKQTYKNIEVVISDDCSADETFQVIQKLREDYKYPIVYHRNEKNTGYDRNYRKCIELGTGDYCLVIGNDDSLYMPTAMERLANFLTENNYPEIGFCNYVEDKNKEYVVKRALKTGVVGSGLSVALKNYNGFSFVGGLIYKKEAFDKYNTGKHDGSIYSQMFLGLLMIAKGCRLFTIEEPLVLKDLLNEDGSFRWSAYRNGLPKSWKEYKVVETGLNSVANVLINAAEEATHTPNYSVSMRILGRLYMVTYPFWLIQYKKYGSVAASVGAIHGMNPLRNNSFNKLNVPGKAVLLIIYLFSSFAALFFPVFIFEKVKNGLYLMARMNPVRLVKYHLKYRSLKEQYV